MENRKSVIEVKNVSKTFYTKGITLWWTTAPE